VVPQALRASSQVDSPDPSIRSNSRGA
jgi:hypothetical protein